MARNKLVDLNDHLFAQMERLTDEDLEGEGLQNEINRSKYVAQLGGRIIENAKVLLEAKKFQMNHLPGHESMPVMLNDKNEVV